jgi:hypothetical protein
MFPQQKPIYTRHSFSPYLLQVLSTSVILIWTLKLCVVRSSVHETPIVNNCFTKTHDVTFTG